MRVDKGHPNFHDRFQYCFQYSFQIYPARSILYCYLFLVTTLFILISLLQVLLTFKILTLCALGFLVVELLNNFSRQLPVALDYRSATNKWILDGTEVRLKSEQFITRSLIIVYFVTADGTTLTHLVPRDSMLQQQHRCLRKLLMACLRPSRDEQSHLDQQN